MPALRAKQTLIVKPLWSALCHNRTLEPIADLPEMHMKSSERHQLQNSGYATRQKRGHDGATAEAAQYYPYLWEST